MKITTKRARPASPLKNQTHNDSRQESSFSLALDGLRIAKEIAMVSEILSREGARYCFILASGVVILKKDEKKL